MRRRLSQLAFALDVEISQKHLSFIETGRSRPSREMILRLSERLAVPLRERNAMMLAAGFAPVFAERPLDDPTLAPARQAVDLILAAHEPFPALAVDRGWGLVAANAAAQRLMGLVADAALLRPPINVLRVSLAPGGLAPFIVNLAQWRAHILERLRQQIEATQDEALARLRADLAAPGDQDEGGAPLPHGGIALPLTLRLPAGTVSLISTTTVFGTPLDITLSELALETFFPTDPMSLELLRKLADG
jgi:transcriptional regulator with XRE-family HTH domain